MTLEEELALIHQKPAPQPAPARTVVGKTRQQLEAEFDLEPADTTPRPIQQSASTWDVLSAAWKAETVRGDGFGYADQKRRNVLMDMVDKLPPAAQSDLRANLLSKGGTWSVYEQQVLAASAQAAAAAPGDWAEFPLDQDALDQRIDDERKAELSDAQSVLDKPGGGVAEFLSSAARSVLTPANVMLAPLGGGSGLGWKFVAGEFAAGALGSAASYPTEAGVARDLDLPAPSLMDNILMGGITQAGFAGILAAVPKIYRSIVGKSLAHKESIAAATPEGGSKLGTEVEIDRAEAEMRGAAGVKASLAPTVGPLAGAESLPYNEGAVLRSIIGTESGGRANARNQNSSATGLGQFIGSTWLSMIKKYKPDVVAGKTDSEILSMRNDATLSTEMTAMYIRENAATLQANGIATDPGTLYMAHFMGPGGAVKAMKLPLDTPISALMSPKEIAANAGIRYGSKSFSEFTAGDLRRWAAHKMRAAYDPNASRDMPIYSDTSRGYTGSGQVTAGDNTTIDVTYEVVDLASLTRASGDMQPRDRSRGTSDAWISDTAARLDPAQLMPSPTADRGAPIVGPDNVIESGNGRYGAIERAYEYHPDRASAYRAQIEAAGYAVPDGVKRPILVARRKSDLTPDQRKQFVIDAQDSGVAVMTPTEIARTSSRAMTAPVLGQLDPAQPLTSDTNSGFVRAALAGLPRSARNAMFDAGGMLNASGQRQLREAMFARAWHDPDIIEMFTEADQGELKSLMEALATAAPNWAALKADIEAGRVRPEMDISGHVLDAMRLIASARKLAAREGLSTGKALAELLDEVDLIEGAVAPLTTALVRKFWKGGRAASADDVTSFLTRYAEDARKAGSTADMFGATTPRDVLRAIDPVTFADLPEQLGDVRGFARPGQQTIPHEGYDLGAKSPEVEIEDAAVLDALEASQGAPKNILAVPNIATATGSIDTLKSAIRKYAGLARARNNLKSADTSGLRGASKALSEGFADLKVFIPDIADQMRRNDLPQTTKDDLLQMNHSIGKWATMIDRDMATADVIFADPSFHLFVEKSPTVSRPESLELPRPNDSIEEIRAHPAIVAAIDRMASIEVTTNLPQFGSENFWATREYTSKGQKLLGRDAAVDYLYQESRRLAWTEDGLTAPNSIKSDRHAVILLGAPASGKSTVANPYARSLGAAIIDSDEAKKIIPEYHGGIGANAVHEESAILGRNMLARAIVNGDNMVLPKVGGSPGSIRLLQDDLISEGYRVEIVLVDVPPAVAMQRMVGRFNATGRLIPPEIMEKGIAGAPKTYDILKAEKRAHGYAKIDNSPERGQPRGIVEDADQIIPSDLGGIGGDRAGASERIAPVNRETQSEPSQVISNQAPDTFQADAAAARADLADELDTLEVDMPDGTRATFREFLDDLDADSNLVAAIQACAITPGGAA